MRVGFIPKLEFRAGSNPKPNPELKDPRVYLYNVCRPDKPIFEGPFLEACLIYMARMLVVRTTHNPVSRTAL